MIKFKKNKEKFEDGTIFGLQPQKNTPMSTAILTEPIANLPISEHLRAFMVTHGYENLGALIKEGTPKLQRTEGFTVLCFESLLDILDQNDIMPLLSEGDE